MIEEQLVHKQAQEIERLIREVEAIEELELRAKVVGLLQSLMGFHAAGIERLMQIVAGDEADNPAILRRLAGDNLVSSLLLLYGVHPLSLETRVEHAVEQLQSKLASQAARVELLELTDGVLRLRLLRERQSCQSTKLQLRATVEQDLYEAAPDLNAIQFVDGPEDQSSITFVPLVSLRGRQGFTHTLNRVLPEQQ
jgi:Fe-S cluster biogenesis protein NfuA